MTYNLGMAKKKSQREDFKTTLRLDPEFHRTVKVFCAQEGISMKLAFEKAIVEFMAKRRKGGKAR